MSVLLDARPYADAIKAAIKAELGPHDAYDYRQVPGADGNKGSLPPIFVLVSLELRANELLRMSAQSGTAGWRLAVRSLGRTTDEARWAMAHVEIALNEKCLDVESKWTTPIQRESSTAPVWDDGRFAGESVWTFNH